MKVKKNKKGFTLVEILSVIILLGIILTVVATIGFNSFGNTKEKIFEQTKKELEKASKVVLNDIDICDDDLDKDLLESDLLDESNTSCQALKEQAQSEDCIEVSIDYLIDNEYITGNNVLELKNTNPNMKFRICLEDKTAECIVECEYINKTTTETTTQETTTQIGPKIEYNDKTKYIYVKKPLNLDNLYDNIKCYDNNRRYCEEIKTEISLNNENIYSSDGKCDESGNCTVTTIKTEPSDKMLWSSDKDKNEYKLNIIAYGENDKEIKKEFTLSANEYNKPVITYKNPKTEYVFGEDNLIGEEFLTKIKNNKITCKDGDNGKPCKSIEYKIVDELGSKKYERSYDLKKYEEQRYIGDDLPFEPGKYTLYISGTDTYEIESDDFILDLYVLENPYSPFYFYGPYEFENETIDTGDLVIGCKNSDGTDCENWYYELNDGNREHAYFRGYKGIGDEEVYFDISSVDIYFQMEDKDGKIISESKSDAIKVYSSCGYSDYVCEETIAYETVIEESCTTDEVPIVVGYYEDCLEREVYVEFCKETCYNISGYEGDEECTYSCSLEPMGTEKYDCVDRPIIEMYEELVCWDEEVTVPVTEEYCEDVWIEKSCLE